jgi:hypothetical protein
MKFRLKLVTMYFEGTPEEFAWLIQNVPRLAKRLGKK